MTKFVQQQVGPLFATTFPMLVTAVLLIPIVRNERRRAQALGRSLSQRGDFWRFLLLALAGQIPAQLFLTWGVRLSLASNAALLAFALPVTTAIVAYFILQERMTRVRWASFALAIIGVVECSGIDWHKLNFTSEAYFAGNMLIFVAIIASSFYNVYSKKLMTRYSPSTVLFCSCVLSLPLLIVLSVRLEGLTLHELAGIKISIWAGLVALGVFVFFLAMIIFLGVETRLDATQAGLSNYLIPFFGIVVAALMLGERIGLAAVIGGALVLSGTLLITAFDRDAGLPSMEVRP